MTEKEIKAQTEKLLTENTVSKQKTDLIFDLKLENAYVPFTYEIETHNDELNFFCAETDENVIESLLSYFKEIYGDYEFQKLDDLDVIKMNTYYWINGNRELTITETTGSLSNIVIIYKDLKNIKPVVDNKKKFAGSYTIEVKGVSSAQEVEVYALDENGGASWLWVENDGKGGANVEDRKTGTWTATENGITINIRGNSGMISETYELKNNVLTNTQLPKRYLKKTE